MKVMFNDFLVEGYPPCTDMDVLKFYDGTSNVSTLLGSYCGMSHMYPEVIYSTGENLFVKFHTDDAVNNTGFSIRISAVKEGI